MKRRMSVLLDLMRSARLSFLDTQGYGATYIIALAGVFHMNIKRGGCMGRNKQRLVPEISTLAFGVMHIGESPKRCQRSPVK